MVACARKCNGTVYDAALRRSSSRATLEARAELWGALPGLRLINRPEGDSRSRASALC